MSGNKRRAKAGRLETPVGYLLVSASDLETSNRIRARLAAAGVASAESEVGLTIPCCGADWRGLLALLAADLSAEERRETRVAVIRTPGDPAAMHRSIFRSQSIELLLGQYGRQSLADVLGQARITVHLQPLIQYPPGRVHGYECLMRGIDADGTLLCPARLFEAARKAGKVGLLDRACRSAAIAAAGQLADRGGTFFINVVPSTIVEPKRDLTITMEELDRAGLRPQQITLEVVETDKVHDHRRLRDILRYYRKAGFKVALDDVGAGYSSLLSLLRLRPDYIKLDGELVRRAATSSLAAKIMTDLAETARQNGIITIAEGVETPRQFRLVVESGIRITQGYLHARPQPKPLTDEELGRIVEGADRAAGRPRSRHAA